MFAFTRISSREEDRLLRLVESERDFLQMTEKEFAEFVQFFVLPLGWAYPPRIMKVLMAFFERTGVFSPTGSFSNCTSPMMLSSEKYQLLGIHVEHIYFTTHTPHALSPLRE
jgi:hypothetical protein